MSREGFRLKNNEGFPLTQQKAPMIAKEEIATGVFLVVVKSPQIAMHAQPGQFLHIRAGKGSEPLLRRPLSIFKVDRVKGVLSLLFRVAGKGTNLLSRGKIGGDVDLVGPLGRGFEVPPETRTTLLVAGGLGVAPLFFLAQDLVRREISIRFLMGARCRDQLLCRDQLQVLNSHLQVSTNDGSDGFPGLVTQLLEEFLRRENPDPGSTLICSAGPEPMLAKVASLACQFGIPGQISMERHMACGLGACLGCVLLCRSREGSQTYRRVCVDGPVFGLEEVVFGE